jgi:hypothetical protein
MAGGYLAYLCLQHRNQWDLFIGDSDLYHDMRNLEIKMHAAIHNGDAMTAIVYKNTLSSKNRELFHVAERWIERQGGSTREVSL